MMDVSVEGLSMCLTFTTVKTALQFFYVLFSLI
jgi:hypothetical protein